MPKKKVVPKSLSGFKFDTSKYIIMDTKVRRDAATGQLMTISAAGRNAGKKKK